jgi:hypothetical protein
MQCRPLARITPTGENEGGDMATRVTLTNGEMMTIGATIEELEAAIEKGVKVVEFDRTDSDEAVHIVVAQIVRFGKAAEPAPRSTAGAETLSYFAFRGTLAPVNRANGDPAVAVLVGRGVTQALTLAHVEKDQSSRGYRFAKITSSAGPFKTAAEAEAKLGEAAKV